MLSKHNFNINKTDANGVDFTSVYTVQGSQIIKVIDFRFLSDGTISYFTPTSPITINFSSGSVFPTIQNSRITIEGQSNALGVGTLSEISQALDIPEDLRQEFDRVYIFNPASGNYEKLLAGVNNQASWDVNYILAGTDPQPYATFGPELGIAYRWILQHPTTGNLFINKNTLDAQPILQFQSGTPYYTTVLSRLTQANDWLVANNFINVTDDGWVWVQGEGNAGNDEASYRAELDALIASRIADDIIKPTTKQIITQIGVGTLYYHIGVANAKANYVLANPEAVLVTYPPYYRGDNVHLDTRGQIQLAADSYEKIYNTTSLVIALKPSNFPNDARAFWNFEEATGDFASSIGNYPLVRTNGASTVTGKIGNAVDFATSAGQFLTGSGSSDFSVTDNGFTVSGWAKVMSPTGLAFMFGKGTSPNLEYGLYATNGAARLISSTVGNDWGASYPAQSYPIGVWFFFCLRYSKVLNKLMVQINGNYPIAKDVTTIYKGAEPFYVGRDLVNTGIDSGVSIDLLRVFPRYIEDMEVARLYNLGSAI